MKFNFVFGTIHLRYKRFLADIKLDSGEEITAHVANTGRMTSCWAPGMRVALIDSNNPKRKLRFSLYMIHNGESWIGVHTHLANQLVYEAITNGIISELVNTHTIQKEIKIGNSRIDLLIDNNCYIEIKNVTLKLDTLDHSGNRIVSFPDAQTKRGQKHLRELMALKQAGKRAIMFFTVQREDVDIFKPAEMIDLTYCLLLKEAQKLGVEILVYQCSLSDSEITISKKIPLKL